MSSHASGGDLSAVRDDVSSSLRAILLIMVFSAVGLVVVAYPFSAIFGGSFADISALANVVIAYLVGLIPFTILFVLQRVFYALEDTRTPFFMQVLQSVVFVAGVLLVAFLPVQWIAIGIAITMSVAGTVQTVVAAILLRSRLGGLEVWPVVRRALLFFGVALVAASAGLAIVWAMGGFVSGGFAISTRLGGVVTLAVAGGTMAVIYLGLLWLLRNPELRAFAGPVLRRLRRSSAA